MSFALFQSDRRRQTTAWFRRPHCPQAFSINLPRGDFMSERRKQLAALLQKQKDHAAIIESSSSEINRAKAVVGETASMLADIDRRIADARAVQARAMRKAIQTDDPKPVLETDDVFADLHPERERVLNQNIAATTTVRELEASHQDELRAARDLGDAVQLATFKVVQEEGQAVVDELVGLDRRAAMLRARLHGLLACSMFVFNNQGGKVHLPMPEGIDDAIHPPVRIFEGHLAPDRLAFAGWTNLKQALLSDAQAVYSEPNSVPVPYYGPRIDAGGPKPSLEGPAPTLSKH
jgi:hypothetical protein